MFSIMEDIEELRTISDLWENYDYYRLVNPFTHDVYRLVNGKAVKTSKACCYKIWTRGKPCANCISTRACNTKSRYIKIECLGETIQMIVAKPVVINQVTYSLEIITDITDSMLIADEFHKDNTELTTLISEMNYLATRDNFSKLYNRQFMKNKLEYVSKDEEIKQIYLMILDIDKFKQINDTYGHLVGDLVIQKVSEQLSVINERSNCFVGRMGGDEFMILFTAMDKEEVIRISQECLDKIESYVFEKDTHQFSVNISVGMDQYFPGEDSNSFIERVDKLMYENKRTGI